MIYLFCGDDFKKVRAKSKAFVKAVKVKKPEISVIQINEDNYQDHSLENLIGGQGLFEKEVLVVLDNLLSSDFSEGVSENIKELKKSKNVFVVIETGLKTKATLLVEKNAEKTENFSSDKKEIKPLNPFFLADALGRRDKKQLWILFYKALDFGFSPEEIHGILFWQIKAIFLAKELGLKESELKPFAYNKAKSFSKNFSTEELKNFSSQLVDTYHQSRMKSSDLGLELEKLILKI